MAKMYAKLLVSRHGQKTGHALNPMIDSGSDLTLFPSWLADRLHLRRPRGASTEVIHLMGTSIRFWFTQVDLFIPDTDCLIENFRVGFAMASNSYEPLPFALVGTDFLQATGGMLDFGRNRHAIACDPMARGPHSDQPVEARRKRLPRRAS